MISFEEFKKISLKVAKVKEVTDHPDADKLYVVKVDIGGEERVLVAGIKKAYKPEELIGKLVVVVENMQPATIRGVESNGMILAASDAENMVVVCPDKDISLGAIVK
ncbi:hypothetical protein ACFL2G_03725 [Candidatus Omnitrophota bacterium]